MPPASSLAPALWAGPRNPAGETKELGAAEALVSEPAVSAGLAGPAGSDAADTRPWEPSGRLHFWFQPRGATPG